MKWLILHLMITLGMVCISWRDKKKAVFVGCICGLMPGVGLILSLGHYLIEKIVGDKIGAVELLEAEDNRFHQQIDALDKVNHLVAISDALILNDTKIKKEMLLGILREDKSRFIEPLKMALQDEDMEASHYAAVALTDLKAQYHKDIEQMIVELEKAPDNEALLSAYAEILGKSIASGLNDAKRQKYLEETYAKVLEELIDKWPNTMKYYKEKIACEMRLEHFDTAYTYCIKFKSAYEEDEAPYLCLMEYYYITKNREAFKALMEEMRYSPITLSPAGLQNMRFWLGGTA